MSKNKGRKTLIIRILILLIAALAVIYLESNIVINTTDSVKYTIMYNAGGTPQKGDYVTFMKSHEYLGKEPRRLTKILACMPGQTLVTENRNLYCDKKFLGWAKRKTSSGKPLEPFQWNGPIPEGMVFLSGDNPASFDSRYWGFIEFKSLEKLVPII